MYKIYFEEKLFASVKDIETACALALSVHRSSNESHKVTVTRASDSPLISPDVNVITFSFTPKETK